LIRVPPYGDTADEEATTKGEGSATMKWYISLILGLSLVLGASVSRGEWRMRIQQGATIEEHALADIDSLTFYDGPPGGMVWIQPGNVRLGQAGIAEPVNDFYVEGFYIDKCEVSNAKYKAFIDAGGYTTEAYWNPVGWVWRVANSITLPENWSNNVCCHGGGIAGNEQFPVNGVSWWEADAYCRWAGGRLPTEAEWEKAAKGGCEIHGDPGQCDASDTPTYPWGEGISGPQANDWNSGDPYENDGWTTPVGYYDGSNHGGYQTIDSPSPYGLYDVAGNVWEWCSTALESYPYDPNDGREEPPVFHSMCCRVLRGGSWHNGYGDYTLRCAGREGNSPAVRYTNFGFRCARSD
jgi:formylglycine-generating enzyme required for sulfatase activity